MTIVSQRSRIETYESCPKKFYWNYLHGGHGIQRKQQSIPLALGGLVHEPLAQILEHVKSSPTLLQAGQVSDYIQQAQQSFMALVKERGLLSEQFDGDDANVGKPVLDWQVNEALALIEVLVLGWVKVRLPRLLEEYEVVDVEQEQQIQLVQKAYYGPDLLDEIVYLTRRDALLRRKQTGELYVLNFKTTSSPDRTWLSQWRYDQQTISEMVAAQQSYPDEVVRGVLVEGLVKGKRNVQWPKDSRQWRHNSPLLYGWKQDMAPFVHYAFKYDWVDEDGKDRRLGKGWERCMGSNEMSGREWLDKVMESDPLLVEQQFIPVPAILRQADEVEEWKRDTIHKERLIASASHFPKHTHGGNCVRPGMCAYAELCWGMGDPDDPEQFVQRRFNHPAEGELIQIGGQHD